MKERMLMMFVGIVLERLNSEDVRKWLLAGTAILREKIVESPNKYDDMIALPVLKVIEEVVAGE